MTLYEALSDFQDLYLDRLADSSRRVSDPIATDWQKVCNEYDLYFQAVSQGDYAVGTTRLDNIVSYLAGYGLIVDEPVQAPLPLSIYASPSVIDVPVDFLGENPDYSNSYAWVYVYMGGIDDSANWTYAVDSFSNVTANISDQNKVNITALSADYGTVTISLTKTDYSVLYFTLVVNRKYDAENGLSINLYPDTIIIPCDPTGVPLSYSQSYSDIIIREGVTDETANWGLSISGSLDVTANISGGNRVNITNIAALEGYVEVTCTRTGYPYQAVTVYAEKQLQGQAVVDGSSVDDVTIELNVSDQIQLKDDGISTEKVDTANVFANYGSLIEYINADSSRVLVPTIVRRAAGTTETGIESSHSIAFGDGNIALGLNNIVGPNDSAQTYTVVGYDELTDTVLLDVSEGDVSADFVASDSILVWNNSNTYSDNYRYYIHGTIVSASYSTYTSITITPSFTVDPTVYGYVYDVDGATGTMVCAHYVESGSPDTKTSNIIVGADNKINGSKSIVFGRNWDLEEGPASFSESGNILIGNGLQNTPLLGNMNLFVIGPEGSVAGDLTYHEESTWNVGVGGYLTFGKSSDTAARRLNLNMGTYNECNASGSVVLGVRAISNTDGEIVLSACNQNNRKVFLQLTTTTTSTSQAILKTLNENVVSLVNNLTDPGHFNMVNNSVFNFIVNLVAVQATGLVFRRRWTQMAKNVAGITSIIGSKVVDSNYNFSDFGVVPLDYGVTADDVNDQLNFYVQAGDTTSTDWLMMVEGEVFEF